MVAYDRQTHSGASSLVQGVVMACKCEAKLRSKRGCESNQQGKHSWSHG
jgi:hypothetical protein